MNLLKKYSSGDKIIWVLTTVLLASFYIFASDTWGVYILLITTLLILFIHAYQNNMVVSKKLSSFHRGILLFACFVALSAIWAWNSRFAIDKAITLIGILICMSVLYMYYEKLFDNVEILLGIVMWAGFVVSLYTFAKYGFAYISSFVVNSTRFEDAFANVNSIAMLCATSVIITFYFILYRKFNIMYLLIIPEIYLIAATASRKALVMLIAGIIVLLFVRFASKNILSTALKFIVLIAILYFIVPYLLELPIFSELNFRMRGLIAAFTGNGVVDHSSLLRQEYIRIGFNQFLKSPIWGIGIGNSSILLSNTIGSGAYLHNNYIELLACGGILGFLAFYRMYIKVIRVYLKRMSQTRPELIICMVLLIITLIMDYGCVSYYSKNTFFYLMIFYLEYEKLLRNDFERE